MSGRAARWTAAAASSTSRRASRSRLHLADGALRGLATITTAAGVTLEGTFDGLALEGSRAVVRQPPPRPADAAAAAADAATAPPRGWYDGDIDAAALEASLRTGQGAAIVRQGHGEAVLSNGDRYVGERHANAPHGEGAYTYAAADEVYTGGWADGLRHGRGVLKGGNMDEYVGGWRDGVRCGRGTQTFGESGDVLEGAWEDDHMEGEGTLTTGKGDVYEGRASCARCARATTACARTPTAPSTRAAGRRGSTTARVCCAASAATLCEGHWLAGEMVGHGRRIYATGEEYVGDFSRGLRHGRRLALARRRRAARRTRASGPTTSATARASSRGGMAMRREGTWRQDRLHGPSCVEVDAAGDRYAGGQLRQRPPWRLGRGRPLGAAGAARAVERPGQHARRGGRCSRDLAPDAVASALAEFLPLPQGGGRQHRLRLRAVLAANGEVHEGFFRDGVQDQAPACGSAAVSNAEGVVEDAATGVGGGGGDDDEQGADGGYDGAAAAAAAERPKPLCVLGTFKGGLS